MSIKERINLSLKQNGVAILPPMDAEAALSLLHENGIRGQCTMLDPWYNKGTGGVLPDDEYDAFIKSLLDSSAKVSDIIYLWGFPEVIGPYVRFSPDGFHVSSWLTWYYKNCPSVIRGWRSSQNACIQYTKEGYHLHPEHFLNDEQKARFDSGNMRFIPGPSSVIEAPLLVGFVGKKEQTGHPSQKPVNVFDRLLLMALDDGELVIDPMADSGTTGASAIKNGFKAILCDLNEEYISMMEDRLQVQRIRL